MKPTIIGLTIIVSIMDVCFRLNAQTVAITTPDPTVPATVVTESQQINGFQLVAQATPANGANGTCVTFDWTDNYGGDWGSGEISNNGLTSKLKYWPPGSVYGKVVTMSVTVKYTGGPASSPATANLAIPLIVFSTHNISYYDGTLFPGNSGDCYTTEKIRAFPDPTSLGFSYSWSATASSSLDISATQQSDPTYCLVASSGGWSDQHGDQDVQLSDSSGDVLADVSFTVIHPNNYTIDGSTMYVGYINYFNVKAWLIEWQYTYFDQFPNETYPLGALTNETFGAASGDWATVINGAEHGGGNLVGGGIGYDDYSVGFHTFLSPSVVWKGDSGDSTPTGSQDQAYFLGSNTEGEGSYTGVHTNNYSRGYQTPTF